MFKSAYFMHNGIRIDSNEHVVVSTIDELGKITTQRVTIAEHKKQNRKKILSRRDDIIILLIILLSVLFLIAFATIIRRTIADDGYSILRLGMINNIVIPLALIFRKDDESTLKFHSAKHMLFNAYKKLNRPPSIEEIRQYSQFDNNCRTNLITVYSMVWTLMFLCTFAHDYWDLIIKFVFGSIMIIALWRLGILNIMQKFVTMEPTDKELTVVIEAMKMFLESEEKEKNCNKVPQLVSFKSF